MYSLGRYGRRISAKAITRSTADSFRREASVCQRSGENEQPAVLTPQIPSRRTSTDLQDKDPPTHPDTGAGYMPRDGLHPVRCRSRRKAKRVTTRLFIVRGGRCQYILYCVLPPRPNQFGLTKHQTHRSLIAARAKILARTIRSVIGSPRRPISKRTPTRERSLRARDVS